MINKPTDFTAQPTYRTTEQAGRTTPAVSGYRPQVKFDFSEKQMSAQQIFLNKKTVSSGETVEAGITIISPHFFEHQLNEGMKLEFREGAQIIGTGVILKILNPKLLRANV